MVFTHDVFVSGMNPEPYFLTNMKISRLFQILSDDIKPDNMRKAVIPEIVNITVDVEQLGSYQVNNNPLCTFCTDKERTRIYPSSGSDMRKLRQLKRLVDENPNMSSCTVPVKFTASGKK